MPELPVVGDAPSKAGSFVTKRVGPLPVWGWAAAGVGAFLAIKLISGRSSSAVGGAGIATAAPIAPPVTSPGAASGSGSFPAPPVTISPGEIIVQPFHPAPVVAQPATMPTSTPPVVTKTSSVGATPLIVPKPTQQVAPPSDAFKSEPGWYDVGQFREKFVAHADAPVAGVIADPAAFNARNAPGGGYSAPK